MRCVGTVVRGIRTPIIKEDTDLVETVIDSLMRAKESEGFEFRDRDIIAITEAVVGISEGNYVSVIGNKANAITGMKGYINELYSTSAGKLLGYKVLEEEEKTGTKYHTLWFNMTDISEITSIRINEDDKKDKSTIGVYLNGSTTLFAPTYNKKFGVKTSRKYDIEFRTRYFYGLDADNNLVEYEIQIPMMFIQDNHDEYTNFTDYPSDISKDNNIESEVSMASATLAKIRSDYEAYINEFKENKQMMTSEAIVEFINE